jgi:hypothetical protein
MSSTIRSFALSLLNATGCLASGDAGARRGPIEGAVIPIRFPLPSRARGGASDRCCKELSTSQKSRTRTEYYPSKQS